MGIKEQKREEVTFWERMPVNILNTRISMSVKYIDVNTKVRAMYAKTFREEDYEELMRQKSVYASIILLKAKEEYEEYLKNLGESSHRGELEKKLQESLIKDIERIAILLDGQGKQYFKILISKYIDDNVAYNNKLLYLYTKKYLKNDTDILDLIGSKIDVLNIISIYRAKKYYHLPKDKIMERLIKVNYKLSKDMVSRLSEQTTISDLFKILEETRYAEIFETNDEDQIEKNAKQFLFRIYKKHFRQDIQKLSNVLAYIFLREIEIENIINIIEGIRYGQDMAITKEQIIY